MKNVLLTLVLIASAHAQAAIDNDTLYHGHNVEKAEIADVISQIEPGSAVIISEHHELPPHREKQLMLMEAILEDDRFALNVGMEFLTYTYQNLVDQFVSGDIEETAFLKSIRWGKTNFDMYRDQILFPRRSGGRTLALNSPRDISGKIAKSGIGSLTEKEASYLPPNFVVGNDLYRERFRQAVGGDHVPPEKLENYFAAQSLWDDTMAWRTQSFLAENPDDIVVIVVGDFHASYGGGLPDRLRARGVDSVVTISQVNLAWMSDERVWEEVAPHDKWGDRADFVWTSTSE